MASAGGTTWGRGAKRDVEWVGAIAPMPAYVTGEGASFRPDVLVWMMVDGPVVGHAVGKPGELLDDAAASLRDAMASPLAKSSGLPARIRVPSRELASALRGGLPAGIEIVTAPTPELDDAFASMREHMRGGGNAEPSYLGGGAPAAAVGALFRAAARLYRARPWKVVPTDQDVIGVTIPALGVNDGVISVIGQMGESFGLVLFASHDDLDAYLEAADAVEHGEKCRVPSHVAINFDRAGDLPPALRREAARHGWELAAPAAFPCMSVIDEDMVGGPPSASDVAIGEAVALAVAEIIEEDRAALLDAFAGGRSFRRALRVKTLGGEVDVTLVAPARGLRREAIPNGPLAELAELEDDVDATGEIDPDARKAIEDDLLEAFAASPEARGVERPDDVRMVLDYAADYLGETVATLEPRGLREVLFELIPRKVCVEPSRAKPIVEATRGFYAFMKRAHDLPQADACLRVLGPHAVEKLEGALSDPGMFGMAKSMMMAGEELGFDVRSEEGLRAWMTQLQKGGGPLDLAGRGGASGPSGSHTPRPSDAKKKAARKQARKARRKNR